MTSRLTNVPLQPRRLITIRAAVGWKRMLASRSSDLHPARQRTGAVLGPGKGVHVSYAKCTWIQRQSRVTIVEHSQRQTVVLKETQNANSAEGRIVRFRCDASSAQAGADNRHVPVFTGGEMNPSGAVHRVTNAVCTKVPEQPA